MAIRTLNSSRFFCVYFRRRLKMNNFKKIADVNEDIDKLLREKEQIEKELQQLENQERKIRRNKNIEERKKRTKRLIQRGAMLESYIEGAELKNNEEIQIILDKIFLNLS